MHGVDMFRFIVALKMRQKYLEDVSFSTQGILRISGNKRKQNSSYKKYDII